MNSLLKTEHTAKPNLVFLLATLCPFFTKLDSHQLRRLYCPSSHLGFSGASDQDLFLLSTSFPWVKGIEDFCELLQRPLVRLHGKEVDEDCLSDVPPS